MHEAADVVVVGSVNVDETLLCPRLPAPGETTIAREWWRGGGGKGANQAAAAAAGGARTRLVAVVGDDPDGEHCLQDLARRGVDLSSVRRTRQRPTGLALVVLGPTGDNLIAVRPGANRLLDGATAVSLLESAPVKEGSVVLISAEIPPVAVEAAARAARRLGARPILNLAPAPGAPPWLGEVRPTLVVNEHEVRSAGRDSDLHGAARALALACEAVIVTVGPRGALIVTSAGSETVTAPRADALDTTGAGDAFCGALAAATARGESVRHACEVAVRAGAAAVQRPGARARFEHVGDSGA